MMLRIWTSALLVHGGIHGTYRNQHPMCNNPLERLPGQLFAFTFIYRFIQGLLSNV